MKTQLPFCCWRWCEQESRRRLSSWCAFCEKRVSSCVCLHTVRHFSLLSRNKSRSITFLLLFLVFIFWPIFSPPWRIHMGLVARLSFIGIASVLSTPLSCVLCHEIFKRVWLLCYPSLALHLSFLLVFHELFLPIFRVCHGIFKWIWFARLSFVGTASVISAPVSCVLLTYFQSVPWRIHLGLVHSSGFGCSVILH